MIERYSVTRLKCNALIKQAVNLHMRANTYHAYEHYSPGSKELASVRKFARYIIDRALDEVLSGLEDRIESSMKRFTHYGFVAGDVSSDGRSGTGTWMVRIMTLRRMLSAIHYIPFAKPGDHWNIDNTNIHVFKVKTTEYSWVYDISMQTEEQKNAEDFEVTDGFEAYYWALKRGEDRFVPYPFEGLYKIKRESLEQTVRITM